MQQRPQSNDLKDEKANDAEGICHIDFFALGAPVGPKLKGCKVLQLREFPNGDIALLIENQISNGDGLQTESCRQIIVLDNSLSNILSVKKLDEIGLGFIYIQTLSDGRVICIYKNSVFTREAQAVIIDFYCNSLLHLSAKEFPVTQFHDENASCNETSVIDMLPLPQYNLMAIRKKKSPWYEKHFNNHLEIIEIRSGHSKKNVTSWSISDEKLGYVRDFVASRNNIFIAGDGGVMHFVVHVNENKGALTKVNLERKQDLMQKCWGHKNIIVVGNRIVVAWPMQLAVWEIDQKNVSQLIAHYEGPGIREMGTTSRQSYIKFIPIPHAKQFLFYYESNSNNSVRIFNTKDLSYADCRIDTEGVNAWIIRKEFYFTQSKLLYLGFLERKPLRQNAVENNRQNVFQFFAGHVGKFVPKKTYNKEQYWVPQYADAIATCGFFPYPLCRMISEYAQKTEEKIEAISAIKNN